MAAGIHEWRKNLWADMVIQWQIFIPVQVFNFTVNPPHLRIPFLATAGFAWVMVLSFLHGEKDESAEASTDETVLVVADNECKTSVD